MINNNFNLIQNDNYLPVSLIIPFKIYNISIIIIYDNNSDYKKLLNSILNQEYLYYLDIELIIIDNTINNGKNNFNKIFNKSIFKKQFYNKNINIKIVELNKKLSYSIIKNIGIECSSNKNITFLNFDEFINDNNIIFKSIIYENIINKYKNIKILASLNNKFIDIKKIDKHILLNIFKNTVNFLDLNIEYLFFDKELIKLYFPNKNIELKSNNDLESNLIFALLNIINNNFLKNDSKNISIKINKIEKDNKYFLLNLKNFLEKKINYFDNYIDNLIGNELNSKNNNEEIDNLLKKVKDLIIDYYYDNNMIYTDFIESIYNY